MKQNYITAVLEELKAGKQIDSIIAGLKATLQKRGHGSLLPAVLRGVLRVLEADRKSVSSVTVASSQAFAAQANEINTALAALHAEGTPQIHVDKTIIGGFITEANAQRIDNSYKTKLVTLYRSLTK